ncbi:protein tis11 [Anaeramoeba flamelloides]|uniref:Protein tis11 n=1 Tax=Anaeramoeba flamelloides TaxID=1746091 RepID=A0AAV7Y873_9EUKA|nr:protein tis11 [Anaeramoeba flamelloides]
MNEHNKENLNPQLVYVKKLSSFSFKTKPKNSLSKLKKIPIRSSQVRLGHVNQKQPRKSTQHRSPYLKKREELKKILKYKTEMCKNYHGEGCFCSFGKNCNYIHNKENPESIALSSVHTLKKMGIYHLVRRSKLKIRLDVFDSLSKNQILQKSNKNPLKQI